MEALKLVIKEMKGLVYILYDCPTRVAATSDFTMIDKTSVSRENSVTLPHQFHNFQVGR
jgi:hypothetical protein